MAHAVACGRYGVRGQEAGEGASSGMRPAAWWIRACTAIALAV